METVEPIVKAIRMELDPIEKQLVVLEANASMRLYAWNWALNYKSSSYKICGTNINVKQLCKAFSDHIVDVPFAFVKLAHSQVPQQAFRDLDNAFKKFFKKQGRYPRFKKRGSEATFRIPQNVKIVDGYVIVPKLDGPVKLKDRWIRDKSESGTWFKKSQELVGKTNGATIKCDAIGHWWITFIMDVEVLKPIELKESMIVGIDLGLKDFMALSTGEKIANPRFFRQTEKQLRFAQRKLSRRARLAKAQKIWSNRYLKAKKRVASIHLKKANRAKNFVYQQAALLMQRFDGFAIEDLCLKGMAGALRLGKSVHDACLGMFRRILAYKVQWNGKFLVVIDRWFPSSKRCHVCGNINKLLSLSDREWNCIQCKTHHDRDHNASINILEEGIRLFRLNGILCPSTSDTGTLKRSLEILEDLGSKACIVDDEHLKFLSAGNDFLAVRSPWL